MLDPNLELDWIPIGHILGQVGPVQNRHVDRPNSSVDKQQKETCYAHSQIWWPTARILAIRQALKFSNKVSHVNFQIKI